MAAAVLPVAAFVLIGRWTADADRPARGPNGPTTTTGAVSSAEPVVAPTNLPGEATAAPPGPAGSEPVAGDTPPLQAVPAPTIGASSVPPLGVAPTPTIAARPLPTLRAPAVGGGEAGG